MSDLLTHWAVFDDARRLAAHDPQVEPLFNTILDQHRHVARLGAITRFGKRWMPRLLTQAREQTSAAVADERLQQKIAFALGGILHFPADQVFKPLMSQLARADWNATHQMLQGHAPDTTTTQNADSIREISAYYDCHVFRKVYAAGHEEPFSRFLVAENATEPGQALEAFIRTLFQRALLSSHTLHPDMSHFDTWLDNLLDNVQPLYIDVALYVQVFTAPDPAKIAAYQVESAFYADDDPLIRLARATQCGAAVAPDVLDAALAQGANHSGYAECLHMSVGLLREASAFWRGEASEPPDVQQHTNWRHANVT